MYFILILAALVLSVTSHITLVPSTVNRNSYAVSAIRVPHGCSTASTTAISLKVPEGVLLVKPMLSPGWTISTTIRAVTPPVVISGKTISDTVDVVSWTLGPAIPDDRFMDFGLMWRSPDAVVKLRFAITQTCGSTVVNWDQIPANDTDSKPLPAAAVSVIDPPPATNYLTPPEAPKSAASNLHVAVIPAALAVLGTFLFL